MSFREEGRRGCSLILKEVSLSAEGWRDESWCVNKVQTKDGKCLIVELEKQHGEWMNSKLGIVETRSCVFLCFFC